LTLLSISITSRRKSPRRRISGDLESPCVYIYV